MPYDTTKQSVLFENFSKKAVVAKFDQDHVSSDGRAVLLKACDKKLKLSTTRESCLSDDRQQSKGTHSLEELFRQRLFAIACGYADAVVVGERGPAAGHAALVRSIGGGGDRRSQTA